jgi:hypothetical protein
MRPMNESTPDMVDQDTSVVSGGAAYLHDLERRPAPYFERDESQQRAMAYLRGLLSPAERKNSWQLAEVSGDATPYGFQHLLRRALWDPEAVRDELRRDVLQHLGDPEAVLVLDETGFLNKGRHSAGVARQYRGTAGMVDNGQVGVFLGYASPLGHALLDRELSLPEEWTDGRERCRQAGIPDERRVATKPQLAQQMLARVLAAGVPARWVTGDSVYGHDRRLRLWLEAQPQAYVLAVSGQEYVWLEGQQRRVTTLLAALPDDSWPRLSAGDGTKGPPYAPRDVGLRAPDRPAGGSHRRGGVKKKSTGSPAGEPPSRLQSRAWPGIPLSVQEIRRLLWRVGLARPQTAHQILAWSHWRRRHQASAKHDHDKRRGAEVEALAA